MSFLLFGLGVVMNSDDGNGVMTNVERLSGCVVGDGGVGAYGSVLSNTRTPWMVQDHQSRNASMSSAEGKAVGQQVVKGGVLRTGTYSGDGGLLRSWHISREIGGASSCYRSPCSPYTMNFGELHRQLLISSSEDSSVAQISV
ncbi:hypothetical protein Tco_0801987 [Tanacetum coccineum]|uniref:Uncharacterized protein n=1 Tax=Tanacetum coccineum TaxID=301880 RepID=A0ABQ4ZXJ5_9ASTR